MIVAAGGTAIAVRVDHTARCRSKACSRACIVNRNASTSSSTASPARPAHGRVGAVLEIRLLLSRGGLKQAVVSHLITAKHAAPLMMRNVRGLIVEVTEGDSLVAAAEHHARSLEGGPEIARDELRRLLRSHGIASVAITPGFLRSEMMLQHFGVTETTWRDAGKKDPTSSSPNHRSS